MNQARSSLALLSAAAKGAAMAAFLLPWVNIAVGRHRIVSASGVDLALGHINVRVPILGNIVQQNAPLALPLLLAEIALAAGLAFSLVARPRRGAAAGLILSGLALCLIGGFTGYGIYSHRPLPPEQMSLIERVADSIVRQTVHVGAAPGFWLTVAALLGAMLLDAAMLRSSAGEAVKVTSGA